MGKVISWGLPHLEGGIFSGGLKDPHGYLGRAGPLEEAASGKLQSVLTNARTLVLSCSLFKPEY